MVEYGHKLEEKMKAMKSEIKENEQRTNSDGKETGTQINGLEQKEERNIQPEQNKETRIQKNEERLRNLQDIFFFFKCLKEFYYKRNCKPSLQTAVTAHYL